MLKFSEIWYVNASQQKKFNKFFIFYFGLFWPKKQQRLTENEENWQNSNRLMKFSEIWYVDIPQQKKILQKNYFLILAFSGLFLVKKQPKLTKNEKKLAKSQPFDKIF